MSWMTIYFFFLVRASFNLKAIAYTHINFNILGLLYQHFKNFETLDEFFICKMSVVVTWGLCLFCDTCRYLKHTFWVVKSCFFIVFILPTVVAKSSSKRAGHTVIHSTTLMIPKNAMISTEVNQNVWISSGVCACNIPWSKNKKWKRYSHP